MEMLPADVGTDIVLTENKNLGSILLQEDVLIVINHKLIVTFSSGETKAKPLKFK